MFTYSIGLASREDNLMTIGSCGFSETAVAIAFEARGENAGKIFDSVQEASGRLERSALWFEEDTDEATLRGQTIERAWLIVHGAPGARPGSPLEIDLY